ncbi:MAG: shikimate dehydrogenase [Legionellales bacterium]|nr:shikimate dehydrogenase [Legionellales bacterium]|tara:strand:+ start:20488 stop:21321 length:834 start_codon:yes stop_codon:yes gene_type:complete
MPTSLNRYAVIGNPVEHSLSPQIQRMFAEQTGIAMTYEKCHAELDKFTEAVQQFRKQGGKGMNITLPFKEQAFELADILSPRAELARAVNVFLFTENGKILGDNTDGFGLVRDLQHNHHCVLEDKAILLLGAGGSARGCLGPLLDEYPREIIIANRTLKKAQALADEFQRFGSVRACGYDDEYVLDPEDGFDLIINTTSASIQGEMPPLANHIIADGGICYDLMYGLSENPFLDWADSESADIIADGLGMLVEQAAESFHVWHGIRPDTGSVLAGLR